MATTHTNQERTSNNRQTSPRLTFGQIGHFTRCLDFTASAAGCVLIYAGVLFSAGLAAAYLAALLPGIAGIVALFTVGPPLIGGAPEIARRVCNVFLDGWRPSRGP